MAPKTGPFPAFETEESIDNDLGLNLPTWKPSFDSQQTKTYIKQYETNPRQFQPAMLRVIDRHAKHHRVPFAYNAQDNEASIGSIVKNIGGGFVEGFTTLSDAGAPKPRNEWDAIARNLGHLGGFLGYIPTFGRTGTIAKIIQKLRNNSAPLWAARHITRKTGKVISKGLANRNDSVTSGIKFLQQPVVKDIAEGSFNLGVASSISSWRGGVDEMMSGFIGGAATGGVFRAIGNYVQVGKLPGQPFGKGGETADKILRGVSSSLFDGLQATAAGATTPEQIYSYLLGAYFGVTEMPYHRRLGAKFLQKTRTSKYRNDELETVPGWEKLDERTRTYVIRKDAEIPKGKFMTAEVVKQLREEGLITQDSQQSIEQQRQEFIKQEQRIAEDERKISIKDIIETDPVILEKREGTKDFNQDNLDFELSDTIKQKVKNYVDTELQSYTETLPLQGKLKTYLDIQKKWDSLVDKAIVDKINPEPEIRKFITEKYNIDTSSDNHYNFWRSWGNRSMTQELVDTQVIELISTPDPNKTVKFNERPVMPVLKPSREFTDKQGNETILLEERKLIDSIYENAFKNANPDIEYPISPNTGKPLRAFQVVDTVNIVDRTTKDGQRTEKIIDLSDLQKNIEQKGIKDYSKFWNRTMSEMDKRMDQRGMYYFGGKGDAHRQYWLRYHPAVERTSFPEMKSIVNETIRGKKDLRDDLKEWIKIHKPVLSTPDARNLYYKATYSNFLYGLEFNGLSYSPANLKRLFRDKDNIVVKNAKDFNKRQQIWFTSGYSANADFIAPRLPGAEDGTFKYVLVYGPETKFPNQDKLTNKDKNSSYNESEDGGIPARFDTVKALNSDYGIPIEGGFNKSFIVSPDDVYGALIGKYGMHTVTKAEDAWMKKNNIHFFVNALSAKASGNKPYQIYEWKNGKYEFYDVKLNAKGKIISKVKAAPRIYKMPIGDVKTVPSEVVSEKAKTKKLRIAKPVLTNLTPYAFKKIKQEDIDSLFEGTTMKRFRGDDEVNARMDKFLEDPDSARGEIDSIIRDLDSLSIDRLLDGMKSNTKAGHEFASKAYQKVLRVNREVAKDNLQDGEETRNVIEEDVANLQDFESIHERILRVTDTNLSGALHKFINPLKASAFRNYITNELTRPVIDNSTSVRLRPYTAAMIGRTNKEGSTSKLETDDTIFFLDDGFKDYQVKTAWRKKPYTLSELWDSVRTNKENFPIKEAKEVLRAFVIRVPMDSLSGGAALDFAGFTGAPGLGGLIHARVAKKLGGADLDGDKASIYFGDEVHGFHKNWKDMYAEQSNEFLNKDGTTIDNKIKRDLFAETDKDILRLMNSSSLAYSPLRRRLASEAAARGRDRLGVAVSNRANILAAHAAIADLPERKVEIRGKKIEVPKSTYVYEITTKAKKKQLVYVTANKDAKSLNEFRLRARTAIALGSDPMDEAGLKPIETFREKLAEPLFKYSSKDLTANQKLQPIFSFSGANSALYGRNIQQGRRFYYNEIMSRLDNLLESDIRGPREEFSEGITQRNTLIPKISEIVRPLDFSDSVFKRVKLTELNDLYTQFRKDLKDPKYTWLQEVLQRKSLATPNGPHLNNILRNKLYTFDGFRAQLNPNHPDFKLDLFKGYRPIEDQLSYKKYIKDGLATSRALQARERHLNEYIRFGEDAMVNDLADMTSIRLIKQFADKVGDAERILRIHRDSDNFKNRSARLYKGVTDSISKVREDLEPMDKATGELLYKELIKLTEKDAAITKRSQIDSLIRTYKQSLRSKDERDLFDHFMLGTLEKGQQNRIDGIIKKVVKGKKISPELESKIKDIEKQSAGTSLVRLGFSSPSISESNIKLHFDNYAKLFETAVAFPKKDIKRIQDETDNATKPQRLFDEQGNEVTGNPINTNDLDARTQKYIDEIAPFAGLNEGKLGKEESRIATEVIDNIKHYFGGNPLPGSQLNGLARAIVKKDLNAMNFKDFEVFNNFLKVHREGSYIARFFQAAKYFPDYRTDPSKPLKGFPELGRRFYLLFPEAVNRELMMHEINLVEKNGIWKNKRGVTLEGKIQEPTQIINEIRDAHHYAQEVTTSEFEEQLRKMDDELSPFFALEKGLDFHRVATNMMERFGEVRMSDNLNKEPIGDYLTGERLKFKPNQRKAFDIQYATSFRKAINLSDWFNIRDKSYVVTLPTGVKSMKGSEITQEIINIRTKQNKRYYEFLTGKEGVADKYLKPIREAKTDQQVLQELENLRNNFVKDIQKYVRNRQAIPLDLGMDNLRTITKYLQLRQIKDAFKGKNIIDKKTGEVLGTDKFIAELRKVPGDIGKTGQIQSNFYFPRMLYDRAVAAKSLKRQIEAMLKDIDTKNGDARIDAQKDIKRTIIRHKQLSGDWITSNELNDRYGEVNMILGEIGKEKSRKLDEGLKSYLKNRKIGNMFSRNSHIGGASYEPEAYNMYVKNIIGAFYKQVADITAHEAISDFRKQKKAQLGDELTNNWANYLELQSRGMSGEAVNIPEHMLNNPNMKIKGTPYAWFADNLWAKRINKFRDMLGLRGKSVTEFVEVVEKDNNPIKKVISGGQTGVDEMFLKVAKSNNIKTGGTAPKDWIRGRRGEFTLEQRKKFLEGFGLVEGKPDPKIFPERTKKNVRDADGTIAFLPQPSVGTGATIRYAQTGRWGNQRIEKNGIKPILVIKNLQNKEQAVKDIQDFIETNNLKTINGAGPRDVSLTKNQEQNIQSILNDVFKRKVNKVKIKEVRKQIDDTIPELQDWDENTLRKFGQIEAKYQLASLLAHPKSAVANLYGGSVLTLQSTGLEHFRNARDINYLRSKVNKDWQSMGDVYNWVKSHGVVEDFLLYELQINPDVKGAAMQKTIQEGIAKIKKDPDFADTSLLEIAKKNGVTEGAFNAAASFMRVPERILRRDAFVAHYLKAREKFDGLITDYNSPYLIDMARKGVKGTQFLYSAPFRPAWARSSMGKVFSRFQIWAYNSVRFRNDAVREAKIYGFDGEAGKKVERILMGDMFMLGLANMFPYSIFESALPSPWNYLQDSADLMFGDEKERDRAFFGSYPAPLQPLQAVTPPALRLFPPLFKAMVHDDYTRLTDYYLWTMFPFGRIARDTIGPGGLLENPAQAVEKFTGFPYMKFASSYVKSKKELEVPKTGLSRSVQNMFDKLGEES